MELAPPESVCYDFRASCNATTERIPKHLWARRRRHSVTKKRATELNMRTFAEAAWALYGKSKKRRECAKDVNTHARRAAQKLIRNPPTLAAVMVAIRAAAKRGRLNEGVDQRTTEAAAREVYAIAKVVAPETPTHASLKNFALLFTATVISKANGGLKDAVARCGSPLSIDAIQAVATAAAIPDVEYRRFGLRCRGMSRTWRDIKQQCEQAALPPPLVESDGVAESRKRSDRTSPLPLESTARGGWLSARSGRGQST